MTETLKERENKMNKNEIWKSYRFPLILLGGIFSELSLWCHLGKQAAVLKPLGDIFINLMFTIVAPMVFFSIAQCRRQYAESQTIRKILGSLILTFCNNGSFFAAAVCSHCGQYFPAS